MEIHLLPDLKELIRRKVEAGEHESASEVVIHALYLLDARDKMQAAQLEDLRREVQIGLDQCERGETAPFDEQTVRRIKERGRQRLAEEAERLRVKAERMAEDAKRPIDEPAEAE